MYANFAVGYFCTKLFIGISKRIVFQHGRVVARFRIQTSGHEAAIRQILHAICEGKLWHLIVSQFSGFIYLDSSVYISRMSFVNEANNGLSYTKLPRALWIFTVWQFRWKLQNGLGEKRCIYSNIPLNIIFCLSDLISFGFSFTLFYNLKVISGLQCINVCM